MQNIAKRSVAFLLTLVLLVSCIPLPLVASATEGTESTVQTITTETDVINLSNPLQ